MNRIFGGARNSLMDRIKTRVRNAIRMRLRPEPQTLLCTLVLLMSVTALCLNSILLDYRVKENLIRPEFMEVYVFWVIVPLCSFMLCIGILYSFYKKMHEDKQKLFYMIIGQVIMLGLWGVVSGIAFSKRRLWFSVGCTSNKMINDFRVTQEFCETNLAAVFFDLFSFLSTFAFTSYLISMK